MVSSATDVKLIGKCIPGIAANGLRSTKVMRFLARFDAHDIATVALLASLVILVLCSFRDYAISNDEGVQHHYGELIIAYYASGFSDQSVFNFQNLYLYGGLFDIIAVALGHLILLDPYDLRHILCALIGCGGIGANALTARLIAGSRAGLIAAMALSVCGTWYGTMFNHTKDIPFAAAMIGATLFLIRIARALPSPRFGDVAAFGLLAGAALGIRVLGMLSVVYACFAVSIYLPRPWLGRAQLQFAIESSLRLLPALILAYVVMILVWPWAALGPLNPIRALLAFSEFQYGIRTALAGHIYEMAEVPRLYVPIYILIRVPLLTLFGAALTMLYVLKRFGTRQLPGGDIALVSLTVIFPLACQVIYHGPAFTGLRHFLFVLPALTVLAGIGLNAALEAVARHGRMAASGGLVVITACLLWDTVTLVRLHPYENLFYNPLVGGLQGATRRYDVDYWFSSMPEALGQLESYLRRTAAIDANWPAQVYSVAVCGERIPFEKSVTLPQLRFDFKPEWDQSEFFIAPSHMNCDRDLDGKVIGTVERLGVVIAYIKDRRALTPFVATAAR
jgi:hypothetical protein